VSNPKFIITRFTHGSAGKFLSSVLQTSKVIDHWSAIVQDNKHNSAVFDPLVLQHTARSFPTDHSTYMRSEPMVPYNVDLYSASYPRGDNVTIDQYLGNAHAQNDVRLLKGINNNLKLNLIFHKPQLPLFCKGAEVVTVSVTSQREKNWLYKTLWSKHFLEKNNKIHYLPSDPNYCSFYSLVPVLTFNNEYLFPAEAKEELYNKYVINDHTNQWYFDTDQFVGHDTDHQLDNTFIQLDEILLVDKFLPAVDRIFEHHNLGRPDLVLIEKMHQIWLSRQVQYDL
jgi:hypothetical protein